MPDPRAPRLWMLVLLALALWAGEYARRGLWEPDEARYAYVAREMREDGRWIVPHLHGEPYPDKPPLPFWLSNGAALLAGGRINGITARIPTLVAAIAVLWMTVRLLELWAGPAAAWRGPGILLTSYLFWHEGGWGRLDMLLLAFETGALYQLFRYNHDGARWRLPAAYGCLALAVMTKGPVGLGVPLAIYFAASRVAGKGSRLRDWHWVWGVTLALLPAALWLLVAWSQGAPAGYFEAMLGAKSFGRVIHDHHAQPFYYYLTTFPLDFLPWTLLLPLALRALEPGPLRRHLLAWLGVVFVLFSLSVGKRNAYILPAFPAAAMVVAIGWGSINRVSVRWTHATAACTIGLVLLVGLIEAAACFVHDLPLARGALAAGAFLMMSGAAVLLRMYRHRGLSDRWLAVFCSVFLVQWAIAGTFVLPSLNRIKAPIAAVEDARQWLPPGAPVYLYNEQLAIVPLYADRPGRLLREAHEIDALLSSGERSLVVMTASDWTRLATHFDGRTVARPFRMGSKSLVSVRLPAE